jgi:hypothetical protein
MGEALAADQGLSAAKLISMMVAFRPPISPLMTAVTVAAAPAEP